MPAYVLWSGRSPAACLEDTMRRSTRFSLVTLVLMGAGACVGSIDRDVDDADPGTPGTPGEPRTPGTPGAGGTTGTNPGTGGSTQTPISGDTTGTPPDPNAAGPRPLRRLTRREYNNTIRDLLGDDTKPGDQFPDERED